MELPERAAATAAPPGTPLLSVIIPTFNSSGFLPEALASVRAQSYAPLEIIVVDDGSTDDTAAVVRRLGDDIRYLRQENRGPSAARNAGLAVAGGEIVAFLDADDLWPENKLRLQMARLLADPRLEVVLGRIRYVRLPGGPPLTQRFREPGQLIVSVHLGSGIYRRAVFDRIGGFDETQQYGEDVDWFLRGLEHGLALTILAEVTLVYRLHAGNMTRDHRANDLDFIRTLKRSLDRRRAAGGGASPLPHFSDFDEVRRTPHAARAPAAIARLPE